MGMEVPQFDRSAEVELAKTLDAAWESMEQLNPGLGAYLNEVCRHPLDSVCNFANASQGFLLREKLSKGVLG
jgi:hypothetical protein